MSPDPTTRTVAICALTYLRPVGLARLLDGIDALDALPAGTVGTVVIVDNDPQGSARPIVEGRAASMRFPVRYVCEPRRGIATARNRAVAEAGPADVIVYIDDDEWPEPRWLNELLAVMDATGSQVVTGPVIPHFEPDAPGWVTGGRFFDRPRFADRAPINWATTSSVAIDRRVLTDTPFDPRFDRSGGEDTHLFARLREAGHRLTWADEAVVNELIPTSRCSARWLLAREYRRGVTLSTVMMMLGASWGRRAKRAARALAEMAAGVGSLPLGLVQGRAGVVRSAKRVALGAGMAAGMFGVAYDEYATVHGR